MPERSTDGKLLMVSDSSHSGSNSILCMEEVQDARQRQVKDFGGIDHNSTGSRHVTKDVTLLYPILVSFMNDDC